MLFIIYKSNILTHSDFFLLIFIPLMTSRIHYVSTWFTQAINSSWFIKLLSLKISIQVVISFVFLFTSRPLWCLKCLHVLFVKAFLTSPNFLARFTSLYIFFSVPINLFSLYMQLHKLPLPCFLYTLPSQVYWQWPSSLIICIRSHILICGNLMSESSCCLSKKCQEALVTS